MLSANRKAAMQLKRSLLVLLMLATVLATRADAQTPTESDAASYPNRPIRIIVPFPAGGPSDVLARIVGQRLSDDWKQPVLIENRVGANTVVGAQAVAAAPGDGYTLLMAIDSTLTMNQFLYKNLPYDPLRDFVPITMVAKTLMLLMVNGSSDIRTMGDLLARERAEPGKLNYGAGTITSQLSGFLLNKAAGTSAQLVRYNGSAQVTQGLLTNSVQYTIDGPSAALSLIQDGRFRVLAKFDPRPFPPAPDAPLLSEAAKLPNFDEITVWLGLVAPKGTPQPIVDKLQRQVAQALADPGIKQKADAAGLYPSSSTPAEFAAFIRKEAERWAPVVKETGIQYD
ncbi:MAG: Bug family tripartite tricarboxylate transporter substrate binding protein [Candidatus Sulfotelmatobacter sp.]